jgi:hypothetical protein
VEYYRVEIIEQETICFLREAFENITKMRFEILTVTSMKMAVFWDVAPCSLIDIDRRFRGAYCHHHQGLILHGATSQKTVIFITQMIKSDAF